MSVGPLSFFKQTLLLSLAFGLFINLGILLGKSLLFSPQADQAMMAAAMPVQQSTAMVLPVEPSRKAVDIPLEYDKRALMVQAELDHHIPARFILDTGATYTSISEELAESLGYDLSKAEQVHITTANGQVTLPKITLASLTLNGYTARNVEATVMPMPHNVPFNGLLGLSFVKHYQMTIDVESASLQIVPHG